jgi:hypothetical protein
MTPVFSCKRKKERRMGAKRLLETAYDERIALKKNMVARRKSNA